MGKKVNPKVFRMGITRTWQSKWFGWGKTYTKNIKQDVSIRKFLIKKLIEAGVDRVEIERNTNKINISIYTAKPGLIIGRGGQGVEDLKKQIHSSYLKNFKLGDINLNIHEVDRPNLSAQIIVQSMILDIEKRMPFRRVMKQAINRVERAGALGVKVVISGRLNGVEIARTEMLSSGKVPLHTMRADIDYARGVARTTYGAIGMKVWIYKGDKFDKKEEKGEIIGKK
ncbi:30S ribosomal protein S3 [Candidatus Falkowbacteria bacterium RIFOXYB2_FULL_34_18]|uniref:Small ribosomal subunit protein uS3 n=1 Tax=Candidatus Falkowbacteria bacterium RIFOXYD2_FULL_34_120 TaxID=1798007 RepID=A0A1F5TSV6_9BACT|nr:MAG: 30S ribosomal protein S3 [Candidatus Falkowbacteria bacterium RIFOXYB2_FULL_34_18]OGF30063.1 MAG: 30S ribosomal protein S3 [Candidatus Falkowbacteria bacterium RIFOXYC12_FULL_34_55]OGF37604.1 MAG: 30S ribosomal protein S3 [Candidatus Falkowbacteria bacterium RIFOXYC2_FULL_34_220]OGF39359.1 MAG: 30S ribosomal protein S3 [Candidatus Falkowbacteria bacterium RIFOXYD12_FULL_34_57]OGF41864.1 MAG: 30S ribosomal protein S3 [Candidatus Falkowbacteria bacterium RIFOXYD2_FULL_34_120]